MSIKSGLEGICRSPEQELAVFSNAEFLITGNTRDFTIDKFEDVKIVTPGEYWENHRPG